ncbi:hypothetical protein GWK47_036789 [Chionoecetes opilio]|uniref:Uncharacterized protein n=1 Tax=Chionoecetes opilio TaxID=41210 RepID=A0A8J4YM86_CHIOP|nr:hypothetical protein GWK47_036789 [Chionoecetes opilio]
MASAKVTYTDQTQVNNCTRWCYCSSHHHHHHYYYYYCCCYLWLLTWAAVRGAGAREGACTPCNAIVHEDNLTLPFVGSCACRTRRCSTPRLLPPFFRGDFNLTLHLHHVPSTLVAGFNVARLAGLRNAVIRRAREKAKDLDNDEPEEADFLEGGDQSGGRARRAQDRRDGYFQVPTHGVKLNSDDAATTGYTPATVGLSLLPSLSAVCHTHCCCCLRITRHTTEKNATVLLM